MKDIDPAVLNYAATKLQAGFRQVQYCCTVVKKNLQINSPTILLLSLYSYTIWRIEKKKRFVTDSFANTFKTSISLFLQMLLTKVEMFRGFLQKGQFLFEKIDYFKESDRSHSFSIFTLFVLFLFFVLTLLVW